DLGVRPEDSGDKMRHAMLRRRADLPESYARMATAFRWPEAEAENRLIDRPASPERGQLLTVLLGAGIHNLEALNFAGLDLSFAYLHNTDIALLTGLGARLSYADLSGSYLTEADLGGAYLENARFRDAQFRRSSFAAVGPERTRAPFLPENAPYSSFLAGADFDRSVHFGTDFGGALLTAASFDGAVLLGARFDGAALGAATFRGAVGGGRAEVDRRRRRDRLRSRRSGRACGCRRRGELRARTVQGRAGDARRCHGDQSRLPEPGPNRGRGGGGRRHTFPAGPRS